jgi:hypothetical protein
MCSKLRLKIEVCPFGFSLCALCGDERILDCFKFKTPLSWAVAGTGTPAQLKVSKCQLMAGFVSFRAEVE